MHNIDNWTMFFLKKWTFEISRHCKLCYLNFLGKQSIKNYINLIRVFSTVFKTFRKLPAIWRLIVFFVQRSVSIRVFSRRLKSPTITVGSFFSADNLTLNGPVFLGFLQPYNFSISYNSYLAYEVVFFTSSKKLNGAKGYSLRVFSAL